MSWTSVCVGTAAFMLSCTAGPLAPAKGQQAGSKQQLKLQARTYPFVRARPHGDAKPEPLVALLDSELKRSVHELSSQETPPYYIAYQVIEKDALTLSAEFGALAGSQRYRGRSLDVDLRIGSPERDNTHAIDGDEPGARVVSGSYSLPLVSGTERDDSDLRNALWLATDAEYDLARKNLLRVQSSVETDKKTSASDFSLDTPHLYFGARLPLALTTSAQRAKLEQWVETVSKLAEEFAELESSSVTLSAVSELRTFVNTEGSQQQVAARRVRVDFEAETTADDGMVLRRGRTIHLTRLAELPTLSVARTIFKKTLEDVRALRAAPVIEPYVGPALLAGRAAGVLLHEVLGHRIEGHRQQAKHEGQTFASMLGKKIMNAGLSVYDDPLLSALGSTPLSGHYLFDDEGIAAQRASLVEHGIFQGFLLSRAPVKGFKRSNGHGRRQGGHAVVARQANLVVEPSSGLSNHALKEALLQQVRAQGLRYGLLFEEIEGGYTQTERGDTQAFKVMPVMVHRIFLDGRQELVRGVDIEGTPLTALSKIVAVGHELGVFNGICGAESGWVPVSAVSPGLVLSQLEVARKEIGNQKPPILPPPELK